jgi:hypothetical protein
MLHRALELARLDLVTAPERLTVEDEEPRQPVLQDVLEGEADRHRADAEGGQHVGRLHRGEHDRRHHEQAEEDDGPLGGAPEQQAEVAPVAALRHVDDRALRRPGTRDKERKARRAKPRFGRTQKNPSTKPSILRSVGSTASFIA